jgi:hypothetical protein
MAAVTVAATVVAAAAETAAATVAVTEVGNALRERGDTAATTAVSSRTTSRCYCGQSTSIANALFRWCSSAGNIHLGARRCLARAPIDCPAAQYLATL